MEVKYLQIQITKVNVESLSWYWYSLTFRVTGSHDRTIRIWSTDTWECQEVVDGHEGGKIWNWTKPIFYIKLGKKNYIMLALVFQRPVNGEIAGKAKKRSWRRRKIIIYSFSVNFFPQRTRHAKKERIILKANRLFHALSICERLRNTATVSYLIDDIFYNLQNSRFSRMYRFISMMEKERAVGTRMPISPVIFQWNR